MKRAVGGVAAAAVAIAVGGCGSGAAADDGTVTLGMVQRNQGGTSYFQDVAKGAQAEAEAQGVELQVQFTDSTDAQLSAVDSMLASGVDGLIVGVQDPAIGPAIVAKAQAVGVPVLASADAFQDAQGNDVPVVTLDAATIGAQVGDLLAEQWANLGWSPGPTVTMVSVQLPSLETCMTRTDTAAATFLPTTGLPEFSLVDVDYDGTLNGALTAMSATINNHPGTERWVIWSCNDEGVVGALKALANAGVPGENILGVGLGANLACDEFPKNGGYRAAIALDPQENGRLDVQTLLTEVRDGREAPATTTFAGTPVTPSTPADQLPC